MRQLRENPDERAKDMVAQDLLNKMSSLDLSGVTPRCRALFRETQGILKGMASHQLQTGQNRLADNLIEIYVGLETLPHNNHLQDTFDIITSIIQSAAETGLSLNGVPLCGKKVGASR